MLLLRKRHLLAFLTLSLCLAGCSAEVPESVQQEGDVSENMRLLETAYREASSENNRPPKDQDELAAFLPEGAQLSDLLTSPQDGQPITIIYDVDLQASLTMGPVVIAYEKQGRDGSRMVLTTMGVMAMSDEEFAGATFPKNHTPQ